MNFLLVQNSWKNSLKAKRKLERPSLTSDATIQEMREKFGRPGISGRKRKAAPEAADLPVNSKMPRFKVRFLPKILHKYSD